MKINKICLILSFVFIVACFGPQDRTSPPDYYDLWNDDFTPGGNYIQVHVDENGIVGDGFSTARILIEVNHHNQPIEGTKVWVWAERGDFELIDCCTTCEYSSPGANSPVYTDQRGLVSVLLQSVPLPIGRSKESVVVKAFAVDLYGQIKTDTEILTFHNFTVNPFWERLGQGYYRTGVRLVGLNGQPVHGMNITFNLPDLGESVGSSITITTDANGYADFTFHPSNEDCASIAETDGDIDVTIEFTAEGYNECLGNNYSYDHSYYWAIPYEEVIPTSQYFMDFGEVDGEPYFIACGPPN